MGLLVFLALSLIGGLALEMFGTDVIYFPTVLFSLCAYECDSLFRLCNRVHGAIWHTHCR